MPVIDTIKLRRGTAAAWTAANPVLAVGEPGLETDTKKLKFGDGVTAWNALGYQTGAYVPTSKSATGIYVPSDWGSLGGWKTARAAAGSRLVNVVGFGDSIMQGFYSSSWASKSWFGSLIAGLQGAYGDGGSGANSVAGIAGITAGSASNMTTSGGASGTATGGLDKFAQGLNSYAVFPHAAANGATVTVTNVRGTVIQVVYYPTVTASSTLGVTIDGVVQTGSPFAVVGAATALQTLTFNVAAGTHTVVVSFPAGQGILCDVRGLNAAGIVGYGYGLFGRQSSDVNTASGLSTAGWNNTGKVTIQQVVPDLFVYSLGINDVQAGSPPTATVFGSWVEQACDAAKSGNAQCDILLVGENRGNGTDFGLLYPQYMRELKAVADAYGAVFVSLWPLGRNSWSVWNGLGYWGDGTNDGLAGSNIVHPSDAGHAYMESVLLPILTAA